MADNSPSEEAMNLPPTDESNSCLPAVVDHSPAVEVVPGDDSDAELPWTRMTPPCVAKWSDPSFRKEGS